MIAVGLMSGTSADGIEAAAAEVDPDAGTARLLLHRHSDYAPDVRRRVIEAASGRPLAAHDIALLHVALGEAYAAAAAALIAELPQAPDVVAVHGQTIAHFADEHATLQLGDAALVAVRLRRTVVCDFRSADVAAGGQGAPLVCFADHVLFADRVPLAVLNLGGIANLTLLPSGSADDVLAFDTGPANMPSDVLVQQAGEEFDRDGARARRGRVSESALAAALRHPFFALPAPKSAGREEFGEPFALGLLRDAGGDLDDGVATAVALTARTVADALRRETPRDVRWRELLVAGGGAANPALMDALRAALAPLPVRTTDDAGVPAAAREALGFAILGAYRMAGRPNILPRCTGASRAVSAGAVHAP